MDNLLLQNIDLYQALMTTAKAIGQEPARTQHLPNVSRIQRPSGRTLPVHQGNICLFLSAVLLPSLRHREYLCGRRDAPSWRCRQVFVCHACVTVQSPGRCERRTRDAFTCETDHFLAWRCCHCVLCTAVPPEGICARRNTLLPETVQS